MRKALLLIAAAPLIACAPMTAPQAVPATQSRSTLNGAFTTAQVSRGAAAFALHCAACHGDDLKGQDDAPALVNGYLKEWSGRSVGALYDLISSAMPYDKPGSLTPALYADVTAYILSKNGLPAGNGELPPDKAALDTIALEQPR